MIHSLYSYIIHYYLMKTPSIKELCQNKTLVPYLSFTAMTFHMQM